jgi:plastocyanin
MSRRRGIVAVFALTAAAAGVMALGGVGAAQSSKPKVVTVADYYFAPSVVKIQKRGKVRWKWNGFTDNHDVWLTQAPRGVKKSRFRSQIQVSGSFTRRFRKPGKYHFVCTLHRSEMQMDVRVRRPG